jgi:hypothetical protein
VGSLGDARTMQLTQEENYWVCPPLGCVAQVVQFVLESGVRATVVVPDWSNQPWHVKLRHAMSAHRFLKWSSEKPVMWDVCVKTQHHVHLVDKWDFVAFAVGGVERLQPIVGWRPRLKQAGQDGANRCKGSVELWRQKALLGGCLSREMPTH